MTYFFSSSKKEPEYVEKVLHINNNNLYTLNVLSNGYLMSLEVLENYEHIDSICINYREVSDMTNTQTVTFKKGFIDIFNKLNHYDVNYIPIPILHMTSSTLMTIAIESKSIEIFKIAAKYQKSDNTNNKLSLPELMYRTFESNTRNDSMEIDITNAKAYIIQTNNKLTNIQLYNNYLDSTDSQQIENPEQYMEGYYYIKSDSNKIFNKMMIYRKDDIYCGKIEGLVCEILK